MTKKGVSGTHSVRRHTLEVDRGLTELHRLKTAGKRRPLAHRSQLDSIERCARTRVGTSPRHTGEKKCDCQPGAGHRMDELLEPPARHQEQRRTCFSPSIS